ncbi:hypothetical protein R5P67_01540 [Oenococcus oeni]|uniref:Uncharacterized protein n=1 Tax=Oenococcus oeni TaxID=1247 RepID=A0AAQ2ZGD3_OENOE|nr:hypothetical protein [Oenococcus oeni]SYW05243.1 membrane hypothetical protein [Oenococcus oeni]SYW09724.1 membrane hypothetical protein [Oenococcus oeni]VDB98801.1 membrane protein of unknown function [Oenococcus oeni]
MAQDKRVSKANWLLYFQTINDREPTKKEIDEAFAKGQFVEDSSTNHTYSNEESSTETFQRMIVGTLQAIKQNYFVVGNAVLAFLILLASYFYFQIHSGIKVTIQMASQTSSALLTNVIVQLESYNGLVLFLFSVTLLLGLVMAFFTANIVYKFDANLLKKNIIVVLDWITFGFFTVLVVFVKSLLNGQMVENTSFNISQTLDLVKSSINGVINNASTNSDNSIVSSLINSLANIDNSAFIVFGKKISAGISAIQNIQTVWIVGAILALLISLYHRFKSKK